MIKKLFQIILERLLLEQFQREDIAWALKQKEPVK